MLDAIVPGKSQPRTKFDEAKLAELSESIRIHGIIQPLIVGPPDANGKRPLIAGERRWQAARLAGFESVPVLEREAEAQAATEIALVENLQREDLSPLEEAVAFERLARDGGLTQEQIAGRVGRSRSSIANTMRLLTLPAPAREALAAGHISEGHARALLGLDDMTAMEALLTRVIRDGLNVRQTEALVVALKQGTKRKRPAAGRPAGLARLEDSLRGHLGTKVSVLKRHKTGRIVIEFYSDEELDGLAERLLRS